MGSTGSSPADTIQLSGCRSAAAAGGIPTGATYLEALSRNTEIRVYDLVISKPGDGTWIHPRLAVDLARWISAEFAVWMAGWFLEELEGRASQARTLSRLSYRYRSSRPLPRKAPSR